MCRRSGRQQSHPSISSQPEASTEAGSPVTAADAALSLALAHLKRATAARGKPSQEPGGLGSAAKGAMGHSELEQTVQTAWEVYSRCVEVSSRSDMSRLFDAVCAVDD